MERHVVWVALNFAAGAAAAGFFSLIVGGSLAYGLVVRLPQASLAAVLATLALVVGLAVLGCSFTFSLLLLVPALRVLWLLRGTPAPRHS